MNATSLDSLLSPVTECLNRASLESLVPDVDLNVVTTHNSDPVPYVH